jgi:AcrR family transcriptional regulator
MVLDTAETIIINEGYSALTVRKIAMDIGYTVASIYMVFANMADLMQHIKAKTLDNLNEQLQQVSNGTPNQQIMELAKIYLQFASQNFNRWTLVFTQENLPSEEYQEKIGQILNLFEIQFALLTPEYSAQQNQHAARALWAGVHGICVLSLSNEQDEVVISDTENAIMLLVKSFIEGWTRCNAL